MPRFYETTEVDIDIDVSEFIDQCDSDEIEEIIQNLRDGGYLTPVNMVNKNISYSEEKHQIVCNHLRDSYLQMSLEDISTIENIAKKYNSF
jgi:hypothetical protein